MCVWTIICVLGRIVFVGAVSDKVCINLVKIALAGGAAGGSSWCLPAKLLTYFPGLKETIVICWWVGGTVLFSVCVSHPSLSIYRKERACSFTLETCSCTVYWFDTERWTFNRVNDDTNLQIVAWKNKNRAHCVPLFCTVQNINQVWSYLLNKACKLCLFPQFTNATSAGRVVRWVIAQWRGHGRYLCNNRKQG